MNRKDSFTTHRAFCDVLALETARAAASNMSSLTSFCNGSRAYNFMESLMSANMEQTYTSILKPSNGEPELQGSSVFISHSNGELSGHQLMWMHHDKLGRSQSLQLATAPSLFSNQRRHQEIVSPFLMSASGLLQKDAQTGATASISPLTLLGGFEMPSLNSGIQFLNEHGGDLVEMNPSSFEIQSGGNGTMERAVDEIIMRGEELTRDFLGVDAPAICASSLNGWTAGPELEFEEEKKWRKVIN